MATSRLDATAGGKGGTPAVDALPAAAPSASTAPESTLSGRLRDARLAMALSASKHELVVSCDGFPVMDCRALATSALVLAEMAIAVLFTSAALSAALMLPAPLASATAAPPAIVEMIPPSWAITDERAAVALASADAVVLAVLLPLAPASSNEEMELIVERDATAPAGVETLPREAMAAAAEIAWQSEGEDAPGDESSPDAHATGAEPRGQ